LVVVVAEEDVVEDLYLLVGEEQVVPFGTLLVLDL
jgi:hypothetical protein